MKKPLVGVVALLAMTGMAMGQPFAVMNLEDVGLDIAPDAAVPADVTVTVPLWVSGSGTLEGSFGGGMALYLQASSELQITGIDYMGDGMLWAGSFVSDEPVIHSGGQLDLNVVTLLPMAIEITEAPKKVGDVSVLIPAGTEAGDYWIRTWQVNPGITAYTEFSNASQGAFDMTQDTGSISIVPEPVTALLLLAAIPFMRRRRA